MAIAAGTLVIQEQIAMFETCSEVMQGLYIRQYIYTIINFVIILFYGELHYSQAALVRAYLKNIRTCIPRNKHGTNNIRG